jgi:hypothetical protein
MAVMYQVPVFKRRKVMSGKAAKVMRTEGQESVLQQITRSTTAPQRLVQRAGIILLAFAGWLNRDIAVEMRLDWIENRLGSGDGDGSSRSTLWWLSSVERLTQPSVVSLKTYSATLHAAVPPAFSLPSK